MFSACLFLFTFSCKGGIKINKKRMECKCDCSSWTSRWQFDFIYVNIQLHNWRMWSQIFMVVGQKIRLPFRMIILWILSKSMEAKKSIKKNECILCMKWWIGGAQSAVQKVRTSCQTNYMQNLDYTAFAWSKHDPSSFWPFIQNAKNLFHSVAFARPYWPLCCHYMSLTHYFWGVFT